MLVCGHWPNNEQLSRVSWAGCGVYLQTDEAPGTGTTCMNLQGGWWQEPHPPGCGRAYCGLEEGIRLFEGRRGGACDASVKKTTGRWLWGQAEAEGSVLWMPGAAGLHWKLAPPLKLINRAGGENCESVPSSCNVSPRESSAASLW